MALEVLWFTERTLATVFKIKNKNFLDHTREAAFGSSSENAFEGGKLASGRSLLEFS